MRRGPKGERLCADVIGMAIIQPDEIQGGPPIPHVRIRRA
jgi:hypothetical protein